MSEKPIIFSAPMVKALLSGAKTQTRRVVKPRKGGVITGSAAEPGHAIEAYGGGAWHKPSRIEALPSPYGQPGGLLWVRETHAPRYFDDGSTGYRADWTGAADVAQEPKWKPSIYMRKDHARIWLEVTEVRVERLQPISGWDVLAEGYAGEGPEELLQNWAKSWDAMHEKKGHGVNANPYVWVISFRVASTPGRPA